MKKICLLLALVFTFTFAFTFTGCGKDNDGVDKTKTQIYIGNFNGGFGDAWLVQAKELFEEANKEISFESGKKGVQIHIKNDKTNYMGRNLLGKVKSKEEDIFFAEEINYYEYLPEGQMLDLSDIVTSSMTEYGETGTIEGKLTKEQKLFLKYNNKYFALAHYSTFMGINYDSKLFAERGYYFDADGDFTSNNKSLGLDGKVSYDDGLPTTYEEFFRLCDYIDEDGRTPISWPNHKGYLCGFLTSLYAAEEGYDQYVLNYTFSGEAQNLLDGAITGNGYKSSTFNTKTAVINSANKNILYSQTGRLRALQFFKAILENNYYYKDSFGTNQNPGAAQLDYLKSGFGGMEKIAMLIEGNWWENEADLNELYDELSVYGSAASRENRAFAFMPLPTYSGNNERTLVDTGRVYCFANGRLVNEPGRADAVKKFIKFLYSDEQLQQFTVLSGGVKAVKYELTQNQIDSLATYAKSVWNVYKDSKVVYMASGNADYINAYGELSNLENAWSSILSGNTVTRYPFETLKNVSAEDYFRGMIANYNK